MRVITVTNALQTRITRALEILGDDIFTDAPEYRARVNELCGLLPEVCVALSHSVPKKREHKGLLRIIELANEAYNKNEIAHDCLLKSFHTNESEGCTLALFIARELREVADPDRPEQDQLKSAIHALERAREDLDTVIRALQARADDLVVVCEGKRA